MAILDTLGQYGDMGLFVLRVVVALVFLYHGIPKLRNAGAMGAGMGMPAGAVLLLGTVESLSALGLILGVQVPLAAFLLGIVMVGAIWKKMTAWHIPFSTMSGTGWEFDLTLLAANVAILLTGGGAIRLF